MSGEWLPLWGRPNAPGQTVMSAGGGGEDQPVSEATPGQSRQITAIRMVLTGQHSNHEVM